MRSSTSLPSPLNIAQKRRNFNRHIRCLIIFFYLCHCTFLITRMHVNLSAQTNSTDAFGFCVRPSSGSAYANPSSSLMGAPDCIRCLCWPSSTYTNNHPTNITVSSQGIVGDVTKVQLSKTLDPRPSRC